MNVDIGGISIEGDGGEQIFELPGIRYYGMKEEHVLAVERAYIWFLASLLECGIEAAEAKGQLTPIQAATLRNPIKIL